MPEQCCRRAHHVSGPRPHAARGCGSVHGVDARVGVCRWCVCMCGHSVWGAGLGGGAAGVEAEPGHGVGRGEGGRVEAGGKRVSEKSNAKSMEVDTPKATCPPTHLAGNPKP
eukprot:354001-Chlamydomonas_euryale.AAC.7